MKRTLIWTMLLTGAATVAVAKEPSVYLHETFEDQTVGSAPVSPALQRVEQVSVIDGAGRVGEGKVAHYHDDSAEGGALEYNVGTQGLASLHISFDVLNNQPGGGDATSQIIFSVGQWSTSNALNLNANAKRAFGLEFYQSGTSKTIALRVGSSALMRSAYELTEPQHVELWVNDRDGNTMSYTRPDTGDEAVLNPDSFVVWINHELVGDEPAFGYPVLPSATGEVAPEGLPGAETMSYRDGPNAMNLFVFKPEGWKATDRRPALMYFFGGGWTKGTPAKSAGWARWAASQGMVGIAPDYRTKNRFDTSPLEAVADGRAAFRRVAEHAAELGIDPTRIAVGGSSAGGHVALWTAIKATPPGSDPAESPRVKPAALFLSSAVSDTSELTGYTPARFGDNATALSPVHQADAAMPPMLLFHATDDELVNYSTAVALRDALVASGNQCELVTVPEGGHGYSTAFPEWKDKVREKVEQFLRAQHLLPVSMNP